MMDQDTCSRCISVINPNGFDQGWAMWSYVVDIVINDLIINVSEVSRVSQTVFPLFQWCKQISVLRATLLLFLLANLPCIDYRTQLCVAEMSLSNEI